MSGVLLVLRAEAYRLVRSRVAWIAGASLVFVVALRVLAARAGEAAARAQALAAGRDAPDLGAGSAWAPFVDGWRTGLAAGTLLLLIQSAAALAADREQGVLRLGVTRASTRPAVVAGRVLLAPVLVLLVFTLTGLAAFGTSSAFYDFGPLIEDGYELMSSAELRSELVRSSLAVLPAMLAISAFGLCVSAASRTPVGAIGVALTLFLGFDLFKDVLGRGQYWVFAAFSPSLVDGSAMQEMAGVARGYSDAGFPPGLLRMSWILPWPEALLLVLLAGWALSRRSL